MKDLERATGLSDGPLAGASEGGHIENGTRSFGLLTRTRRHVTIAQLMSQMFGYALLALCLFIGYQGYENAREAAAFAMAQGQAKQAACDVDPSCVLTRETPRVIKADVFRRRYEFQTTSGATVVTCDRRYIWLGEWSCVAEKGSL